MTFYCVERKKDTLSDYSLLMSCSLAVASFGLPKSVQLGTRLPSRRAGIKKLSPPLARTLRHFSLQYDDHCCSESHRQWIPSRRFCMVTKHAHRASSSHENIMVNRERFTRYHSHFRFLHLRNLSATIVRTRPVVSSLARRRRESEERAVIRYVCWCYFRVVIFEAW